MFIDDIKYHYTYLNSLKNIVWERETTAPAIPDGVTVRVRQELTVVMDHLTRERPTWRFKSTERLYSGSDLRWLNRFFIYDHDEELGELYLEHHWRDGTPRFYFDNHRLSKARMKNQKNFTTKPDVAAKRILKAFHLKTPKERAAESISVARGVVQDLLNSADWPLRRAKQVIERELFEYASRNWDSIKVLLSADAVKMDLPGLMQERDEAQAMMDAMSNRAGRIVRLEPNGAYMVARPENDSYHVESFTDSTLPDDLRGALGLLKLVEDNNSIADVGVRVDAKLYFVMDRKEEVNV